MTLNEDQLNFLKKQHLHISIPAYGGVVFESVMVGLLKFVIDCNKIGMKFSLDTLVNESLIPRGRINLSAKFMANKAATHMMFIDSDIGFEPAHIFQLLLDDKDLIGGMYPKKSIPIDYVINMDPKDVVDNKVAPVNNLIPVSRLGTGFMLIKRTVFEQMMVAYPQLKFKNNIGLDVSLDEYMYAFFDTGITEDNEYLSEDYYFCDLWRKIGGEIFANVAVRLDHSGYYRFPADPTNLYKNLGVDPAVTNANAFGRVAVRAISPIKNVVI